MAQPSARATAPANEAGSVSSRCDAGAPGLSPSQPFLGLLAAELPGGTEVVGTSHEEGSKLVIVLHGVTADCRSVPSFGKRGTAVITLASSMSLGEIDTMIATRSGDLLLAGSDGRNEIVGRLLPDGRLDSTFGSSGWVRFRPREKALGSTPPAPIATSLAERGSGAILIGGNDQEAHCCVQDFVSALTSNGSLERSFGGSGSIVLPKQFIGSFTTNVFPGDSGTVLVIGTVTFTGCGGPVVVRLNDSGSLDARFDTTVARSIATVSPDHLLFEPTLVPRRGGGFLLLGDISNSCVLTAPPTSRGLALALLPSGNVDRSFGVAGHTSFASEDATWGDTWTAAAGANSILLITAPFAPRSGVSEGLKVREFSNAGSIDRGFAHDGTLTINVKGLYDPNIGLTVAAIAAPGDGDVIAIATQKQIDLFRVQL